MENINLKEITEALKGKELFPELTKQAKETVEKILSNPANKEVLEQMFGKSSE